jgi:2-C-methyl-D-erythritol 4-phosphate cytidylyltransferase
MIHDEGYFEIETRDGEVEDLRLAVKVEYNEAWEAWQVGYTDEDGEHNISLVRGATTREEAHMKGIEVVKEHGFIRGDLWIE